MIREVNDLRVSYIHTHTKTPEICDLKMKRKKSIFSVVKK